jgi:DNA primase
LTPPQVRMLHRFADTVVVNFDPDAAGANATEKGIQLLLDEGLHVRVLTLEGGLDPDEYVKQNGAEAYQAKVESAIPYFQWLKERASARFPKTAEGRMDAFKSLLPTLLKIPDKIEQASWAADFASYLGVAQGLVLTLLKRASMERRGAPPYASPTAQPGLGIPNDERFLLSSLLASGKARNEVLPQLTEEMTGSFSTRAIFDALRQANGLTGPAVFAEVKARLDPASQTLLHELAAADDMSDEESSLKQAHACLLRLNSGLKKRQVDDLRTRVKTAEREGRMEEALRWIGVLHQLERETRAEASARTEAGA